ncbi:MAG: alkaline phosphatase D family protein [Thermoanaerobaculia bacterium]
MLTVRIEATDFMEGTPIQGAEIETVVHVVPRFPEPVIGPPGRGPLFEPDDLESTPGLGATVPKDIRTVLRPDFEAAERFAAEGRTDSRGRFESRFDVREAFVRLQDSVPQEGDVIATASARLSVGALVDQMVHFDGGLLVPEGPDLLGPDDTFEGRVEVDAARVLVGEVTDRAASLLVRVPDGLPRNRRLVLELRTGAGDDPVASEALRPDSDLGHSAVARFDGLEPGTRHDYVLFLRPSEAEDEPGSGQSLARGSFRTEPAERDDLRFVFGSCHLPTKAEGDPEEEVMDRWRELAGRDDYDFLVLMGDQVYGEPLDEVPGDDDVAGWRERYTTLYERLWGYRSVREVMRRTPTYMILDDHDVYDDFGTVRLDEDRVEGALEVARRYQRDHGPGDSRTFHTSFRRGPASFFLVDVRTHREKEPEGSAFPILGPSQWQDLEAWARSPETREADLIFFVLPVPMALLPVEEIERAAEKFKDAAGEGGLVTGALVGASTIAGPVVGGAMGTALARLIAHAVAEQEGLINNINELDIEDQWTFEPNQRDLERLLDLAFDLANDVDPDTGRPGDHPRGVFFLGGDSHAGAWHLIRSNRQGGRHDHGRNPLIQQLISSPISNHPEDDEFFVNTIRHVREVEDLGASDFVRTIGGEGFDPEALVQTVFGEENAQFVLDASRGRHYAAEFTGLVRERNYGRVEAERIGSGRRYRLRLAVEGRNRSIDRRFDLDLDADPIRPIEDDAEVVSAGPLRDLQVGRETEVEVRVRNTGPKPWRRHTVELVGPESVWGTVRVEIGQLRPGASRTVVLTLQPQQAGSSSVGWRVRAGDRALVGPVQLERTVTIEPKRPGSAERCAELIEERDRLQAQMEELRRMLSNAAGSQKADIARDLGEVSEELSRVHSRLVSLGCEEPDPIRPIEDDAEVVSVGPLRHLRVGRETRVEVRVRNTGETLWVRHTVELVGPESVWGSVRAEIGRLRPGASRTVLLTLRPGQAGSSSVGWRVRAGDRALVGPVQLERTVTIEPKRPGSVERCAELIEERDRLQAQMEELRRMLSNAAGSQKADIARDLGEVSEELSRVQGQLASLGCEG